MTCTDDRNVTPANIRIVGCDNGHVFHIHGDQEGEENVTLLEDGIGALWEADVKVLERTPVRMDGGVLRAVKTSIMELELTLLVGGSMRNSFGEVDGELREAFSHELDPWNPDSTLARLEYKTDDGTRWLEVVLAPGQSWSTSWVPNDRGWWEWTVKLKAYVPFWQAKPVIESLVFTGPGTQMVDISNPTGVPMFHQWSGTVAQWRLPDNTWQGPKWRRAPGGRFPDRTILYPDLTAVNGGLKVNYDPSKLPVRDKNDTNLIGTMPVPGDYPKFVIPPFTQKQQIAVTAVKVPAGGAAIKLVQPRQFRRPWGRV